MADTFASFSRKLDKMLKGLSGPELRHVMQKVGEAAQKDAEKAASADLGGDPKFSGWAPVLDTKLTFRGNDRVIVSPGRRSAGPWTVAEFGRNSKAGPRPTVRLTKKGKVSRARVKRWNGRTPAFNTASDATAVMERETPKRLEAEVKSVIRKAGL